MGIVEAFATQPIKLSGKIDGQDVTLEFEIGRMSITVLANFSAWCRDVTMERCKLLAAKLPEDGRPHVIRYACDMVMKQCDWGGEVANALLRSPLGIAKLLHFSLPRDKANLYTAEQLMDLIETSQDDELTRKLLAASGITQQQAAEASKKNPPEAEPQNPSTGASSKPTSLTV